MKKDGDEKEAAQVEQITLTRATVLQITPGAASLPVFLILAYLAGGWHLPNIFALGIAILLVEVPVTWAIIFREVRREKGSRFSFAHAFPWHASIPWWQYIVIGIPVIIFSIVMIGAVGPMIQEAVINSLFLWVPDWFIMRAEPGMFATLSREILMAMWLLILVAMVLVGGFTQELFARGFLLPRTEHFGRWAPAFNAMIFAIFHLIAPWSWLAFFLMTLPWAYVVWWRRSVKIGLFIHVGMLALQWLGMTMLIFGLVPRQ